MRCGVSSLACVLLCGCFAGTVCGQERAADSQARPVPATPHVNQIQVDQQCRIHDTWFLPPGTKPRLFKDRGICDVGLEHFSFRRETDFINGKFVHRSVSIREHTFALHNPLDEPVNFVIYHGVPKGWQVDSDPQPESVSGMVATFLVSAQPGETVNVHVGERNPPK